MGGYHAHGETQSSRRRAADFQAGHVAALADDHALGALGGNLQMRGDEKGAVLHVDRGHLRHVDILGEVGELLPPGNEAGSMEWQ